MKIGISKASGSFKYELYPKWLSTADSEAKCVDLSQKNSLEEAIEALNSCSGLLLTGGPDIEPIRYEKQDEIGRCSVDVARDSLEFALFERAKELKMPILAVCRGLQLVNVALGGTLVVDIPAEIPTTTEHRALNSVDSRHEIEVLPGSLIAKISGQFEGEINSAHHQSANKVGEGLTIAAFSPDGIIEAMQWADPQNKPFLLCVQWHPERLEYDSPFSMPIAKHFLFEAESYLLLHQK